MRGNASDLSTAEPGFRELLLQAVEREEQQRPDYGETICEGDQWLNQKRRRLRSKNFWFQVWLRPMSLAKLLIEKGVITQDEFLEKIRQERVTYRRMLKPTNIDRLRHVFFAALSFSLSPAPLAVPAYSASRLP